MTIMPILIAPEPVLKEVAKPVEAIDDGVRALMDDMLETMYDANGVGLAAPQVGVSKRIVVIDTAKDGETRRPIRMVNPEIAWESDEKVTLEEGCLSFPQQYADVTRPTRVQVRYTDENEKVQTLECDELLGRCVQHELDHLEGALFVERVSALRRGMIMRKVAKIKKSQQG